MNFSRISAEIFKTLLFQKLYRVSSRLYKFWTICKICRFCIIFWNIQFFLCGKFRSIYRISRNCKIFVFHVFFQRKSAENLQVFLKIFCRISANSCLWWNCCCWNSLYTNWAVWFVFFFKFWNYSEVFKIWILMLF